MDDVHDVGQDVRSCAFALKIFGVAMPGLSQISRLKSTGALRAHFIVRNPTSVQAMAINAATSDSPATKPDATGIA